MKAIITKYLPATNYRSSRIKAQEPDGKFIIIPWNHELNTEQNHHQAAKSLCEKMNWRGGNFLIQGSCKEFNVHVFHPDFQNWRGEALCAWCDETATKKITINYQNARIMISDPCCNKHFEEYKSLGTY